MLRGRPNCRPEEKGGGDPPETTTKGLIIGESASAGACGVQTDPAGLDKRRHIRYRSSFSACGWVVDGRLALPLPCAGLRHGRWFGFVLAGNSFNLLQLSTLHWGKQSRN